MAVLLGLLLVTTAGAGGAADGGIEGTFPHIIREKPDDDPFTTREN